MPNFLIHEIMLTDGSFRKNITNEKVVFEDGFIKINDCVGLGIEINEDILGDYPYKPRNLRHYNNALTNIRPLDDNNYYFEGIGNKND